MLLQSEREAGLSYSGGAAHTSIRARPQPAFPDAKTRTRVTVPANRSSRLALDHDDLMVRRAAASLEHLFYPRDDQDVRGAPVYTDVEHAS